MSKNKAYEKFSRYLNKEYTWEELVKMFPDHWLSVSVERSHTKGKVVLDSICSWDDDMALEMVRLQHENKKVYFRMTTDDYGEPINYIWRF